MFDVVDFLTFVAVVYLLCAVVYGYYHAYKIVTTVEGLTAKQRFRMFIRMSYFKLFWRTLERDTLNAQSPAFQSYVATVQRRSTFLGIGFISLVMLISILASHGRSWNPTWEVTPSSTLKAFSTCGVAFFFYQMYIISDEREDAGRKLKLFLHMLFNPLWRITERERLQTRNRSFRTKLFWLEIIKYIYLTIVAVGHGTPQFNS